MERPQPESFAGKFGSRSPVGIYLVGLSERPVEGRAGFGSAIIFSSTLADNERLTAAFSDCSRLEAKVFVNGQPVVNIEGGLRVIVTLDITDTVKPRNFENELVVGRVRCDASRAAGWKAEFQQVHQTQWQFALLSLFGYLAGPCEDAKTVRCPHITGTENLFRILDTSCLRATSRCCVRPPTSPSRSSRTRRQQEVARISGEVAVELELPIPKTLQLLDS